MVLSSKWLGIVLVVLTMWFALLCRTFWKQLRQPTAGDGKKIRAQLTLAGIGLSMLAVGSLLALHLSWISVEVSQHLGVSGTGLLLAFVFWPTLLSLVFSVVGTGKTKFLGIATCFMTGLWWYILVMGAAISMGAPIARHPVKYLIPADYVGWVEVKFGEAEAPTLQMKNGAFVCQIPEDGFLKTSSPLEAGWAKDEYFYYSHDGSTHALEETGWGFGGMIWGGKVEWQQTPNGSTPTQLAEYFYVGTEEQYHRAVSNNKRRPLINESKSRNKAP